MRSGNAQITAFKQRRRKQAGRRIQAIKSTNQISSGNAAVSNPDPIHNTIDIIIADNSADQIHAFHMNRTACFLFVQNRSIIISGNSSYKILTEYPERSIVRLIKQKFIQCRLGH